MYSRDHRHWFCGSCLGIYLMIRRYPTVPLGSPRVKMSPQIPRIFIGSKGALSISLPVRILCPRRYNSPTPPPLLLFLELAMLHRSESLEKELQLLAAAKLQYS